MHPIARGALVALFAATVIALLGGAGREFPGPVLFLGSAATLALLVSTPSLLAESSSVLRTQLFAGGVVVLFLALISGTYGPLQLSGHMEQLVRRSSTALAFWSGVTLMTAWRLPRLLEWLGREPAYGLDEPLEPKGGWERWAVLGVGALFHARVFAAFPPILQIDSYCNLFEPNLCVLMEYPFHHTPLYAEIVKLADRQRDPAFSFSVLLAVQHVVALLLVLGAMRVARLATGNRVVSALCGLVLALDGLFALYAQTFMTELYGATFTLVSALLLLEATRRPRATLWLLGAGASAGIAILGREALQAWPLVAAAWLLIGKRVLPRRRAVVTFLVAAYVPVALMVTHNYLFSGRANLTASLGRSLSYRVVQGLPPLTEGRPDNDPSRRVREIVWENRAEVWSGVYGGLHDELGWDEERFSVAMRDFYLERIRRYPVEFLRVSLSVAKGILTGSEYFEDMLAFHNHVVTTAAPERWRRVIPPVEITSVPPIVVALDHAAIPTRAPFLILFVLSVPLATERRGRLVGFLALLTVGYYVGLASLVNVSVARHRVISLPFLVIASGIGTHGLWTRIRRTLA